jgi:PAS domain S-box-containing protein
VRCRSPRTGYDRAIPYPSEQQDLQERLALVLEGTGTGLWEWRVGEDNVRWSELVGPMFGLAHGESPASYDAYLRLIHPDDRPGLQEQVRTALERGEDYEREHRALWADGTVRWVHSRAHVVRGEDGAVRSIVGLISDVTERKQRAVAAEYLAEASVVLAESLAVEPTLERIAELAVPALADWCTVHLADEERGISQVTVTHQDPAKVELARSYSERFPPEPDAPTGVPAVIRSGRSEVYPVITDEVLAAAGLDPERLAVVRELGLRSVMTVPLRARGRTLGAVSFIAAESGRRYMAADVELAEELGRRAGLAVDNVRLFEEAQRIAEILQRSLLPERLPDLAGLESAARYLPGAAGTEVGGDWYDVVPLASGATAIVVGDVMGRGIPAAALMGQLRTAVRSYALVADAPGEAMTLVGDYVDTRDDVDFATVLLLTLDADRRTVHACSAGHLPPVILEGGAGRLAELTQGPPLGIRGHRYATSTFQLAPGSSLLLYTDGLVERRGLRIDDGIQRLLETAAAGPAEPARLVEHVLRTLLGGATEDDVAVLAVRTH